MSYHYRVTFHKAGNTQYNVETFHSASDMAERITKMAEMGYTVQDVDQFYPHEDPANVRFDYESGERIQYYDADDASEHHLRMMGG